MNLLTRYWGYLALALAIAGYITHALAWTVILAAGAAALGYFLLQAPIWCGAETRAGKFCRRNSHGLLRGCSLREHKWQRIRATFTPAGGRMVLTTCKSVQGALVALGAAAAGGTVILDAGRYLLQH